MNTRYQQATFGTTIKKYGVAAKMLVMRYPWLVAIFGFVSGVASFFLVEREQEKFAQIVSALMLASWVWLALENLLQRSAASWFGLKLPPPVLSFATQMVHQESLFFVIPFFFITTAWNSGQAVFTSLLILFAFISVIDPIYYRGLAQRRWLYFLFHGVTLFAVLLTALPIIAHLQTPKAYLLALVAAVLLSLPGIAGVLEIKGWRRGLFVLGTVVVLLAIGIYARPWVPPATLRLTAVAITTHIDNRDRSPENRLRVVTDAQLKNGLYAYTAIRAPRGLDERIYHVWRLDGRLVDHIALDINGGREAGYRAWSHKLNFPPHPIGRWEIRVVTEAEQVIGILRFRVVKAATPPTDDHQSIEADDTRGASDDTPANDRDMIKLEQPINDESSADEGLSPGQPVQDSDSLEDSLLKEPPFEEPTITIPPVQEPPVQERPVEELPPTEPMSPQNTGSTSVPAQETQ